MDGILLNIKKSQNFLMSVKVKRDFILYIVIVCCNQKVDILTNTNYIQDFVSSFEKENIVGVQFHPEKSHKFKCMSLIKKLLWRIIKCLKQE